MKSVTVRMADAIRMNLSRINTTVIPEAAERGCPESMNTVGASLGTTVFVDSGPALRAPRNDGRR